MSDIMAVEAGAITVDGDTAYIALPVEMCVDEGHPDGYACPDDCPGRFPPVEWVGLCRPCDTCLGERVTGYTQTGYPQNPNLTCPDCVDGRHTFTVETAVQYDSVENAWVGGRRYPSFDQVGLESSRRLTASLRVSITLIKPGMFVAVCHIVESEDR